jgi:hypothetical protein
MIHETVVGSANNLINRRIDENFGLGNTYALTTLDIEEDTNEINTHTHIISAESGTTDDLETINGGLKGQRLYLMVKTGHTITVKETDNISLETGSTVDITDTDILLLMYNGTSWLEIVRRVI